MRVLLKGLWWPLKTYRKAIDFAVRFSMDGIGICYSSLDESAYIWRHPYKAETLKNISKLANVAKEHGLSFFMMLNPTVTSFKLFTSNYPRIRKAFGLEPSHYPPDLAMNLDDKKDVKILLEKLQTLRNEGVEEFMLCFDDVAYDQNPEKEARIANKVSSITGKVMLTPSKYNLKAANSAYLETLGMELNKDVEVFWTGKDVVSLQIFKKEENQFAKILGRVPSLWLNYPVNDYLEGEIVQKPLPKSEIHLLGAKTLLINPMFQFEESKIPILTVLDHVRQGEDYNPQKSWRRAKYLL